MESSIGLSYCIYCHTINIIVQWKNWKMTNGQATQWEITFKHTKHDEKSIFRHTHTHAHKCRIIKSHYNGIDGGTFGTNVQTPYTTMITIIATKSDISKKRIHYILVSLLLH